MITKWVQHLSKEKDIENFKNQIRNASDVLDRLKDICSERIAQLDKEEEDFSAGWEYKQASLVGRRLELKALIKLLDHRAHYNEHPRPDGRT